VHSHTCLQLPNLHPVTFFFYLKKIVKAQASPSTMTQEKVNFKVAVFSAVEYVVEFLQAPLSAAFSDVKFFQARLDHDTANLAKGYDAVCLFVNDICDADTIDILADNGVKFIAMRCAGFDRIDVAAAHRRGIRVVRVPSYSPRSVAEMALTLIMAASRNLRPAIQKVSIGNYQLSGLVGLEVSGKTYGIVGTGKIGLELIKLLKGFEGRILAYDIYECPEAKEHGAQYVDLDTLLKESDIVSLHTPLLPTTRHIINKEKLHLMKQNAVLVNVSRGGLIDTKALMESLQLGDDANSGSGGKLAGVALDVYELEESLFFEDFTRFPAKERMKKWDNAFTVLKSLPQVLITPHIAFLTQEALANIADTTVENLNQCALGMDLANEVKPPSGSK
jgi:D-lactate dehydrogenase